MRLLRPFAVCALLLLAIGGLFQNCSGGFSSTGANVNGQNTLASVQMQDPETKPSIFGLNYWPSGFSSTVLFSTNWNQGGRQKVVQDFAEMKSMGVGALRLLFWPNMSAYCLTPQGPVASCSTTDSSQTQADLQKNLAEFMTLAKSNGLHVIIAFANRYAIDGPCDGGANFSTDCGQYPHQTWWQYGYGDKGLKEWWTSQAFARYLGDSSKWMNGIIYAAEHSGAADSVLFYDYYNEYDYCGADSNGCNAVNEAYLDWYLKYMFQYGGAPAGKRGLSFLHTPNPFQDSPGHWITHDELANDIAHAKTALAGQNLDYVDFHPYPDAYFTSPFADAFSQTDRLNLYLSHVQTAYLELRAQFPQATTILGEFGLAAGADREALQAEVDLKLVAFGRSLNIPFQLHWMLWDDAGDPAIPMAGGRGLGYAIGRPKQIMIQLKNTAPSIISDLRWSSAGPIAGLNCVLVNEPSDPHTWDDNYLCSTRDWGFKWSYAGPIAGMSCVQFREDADHDTWNDNYLCTPSDQGLVWNSAGPLPGKHCVQINEPADPDTWDDNYLCGY